MDFMDRRPVEPTVIRQSESITGTHRGSVIVDSNGSLSLDGVLQGSLLLESGAKAVVHGEQQGSVTVETGATMTVAGAVKGSVLVADGGLVSVTPSGLLAGTVEVHGRVVNAGTRAGVVSGQGRIEDLPGSRVVKPRVVNGTHYYDL